MKAFLSIVTTQFRLPEFPNLKELKSVNQNWDWLAGSPLESFSFTFMTFSTNLHIKNEKQEMSSFFLVEINKTKNMQFITLLYALFDIKTTHSHPKAGYVWTIVKSCFIS